MDVNCTLFVQCANFGIAYIILSRLIFKPILACIEQERKKREMLEQSLKASQRVIQDLEKKQKHAWEQAKLLFQSALAKIPYKRHAIPFTYHSEYKSVTDAQVEANARTIHDAVMKKVSDDI